MNMALSALIALAAVEPAEVDRYVAEYAAEAAYPGVAVAITKGDQVVRVAGYGHDSTGAAVTGRTSMPIASVSKSFTALAVMQLVEQGKVILDAPVRNYFDFQVADPRGERITVRQLLNHTSGINDRTLPEKSLPQPRSLSEAVIRARQATLAAEPGAGRAYTNTNYHLAGRLVEVVAGEPFNDYLRRRIFEPAGMRSTTAVDVTPAYQGPKGHVYAYGKSIQRTELDRFVAGSDGVITTAEDMARWLVIQSTGGAPLVSKESIETMHRDSLGWETDSQGRVRHSGIWFGFTAGQLLTSGYGIAVMANSGVALGNEGTSGLENDIAALLTGETPTPDSPRLLIDLVLAGLTLLSLVLGVLAFRRKWRFTGRRAAVRLAPRFIPLAVLLMLPYLVGFIAGGRDITTYQLAHYSPALLVWVLMASVMNCLVAGKRIAGLVRTR